MPTCVPFPLNTSLCGEFEASLMKLIVPGEVPALFGANVTLNEMLWPAGTVRGNTTPLTEYPSPLQSADLTVTLEFPALRIPGMVAFSPTGTFPKFNLLGDTAS